MEMKDKQYGNITIRIKKKKEETSITSLKDINDKESGVYTIEAKVTKIIQTRGPTIFKTRDDTGPLDIAGFISPGERSYPEVQENDSIRAEIRVEMKEGIKRVNINQLQRIEDIPLKLDDMLDPQKQEDESSITFTIKSEVLDALKDKFRSASKLIKKSIYEGRPILIRHHADMDGYAGAIALEKAIMPLIEARVGERDKWHHFDRMPSTTPFYEYSDVLKDLSFAKRAVDRFQKIEPLVILVDNGSTAEDLLSIRKAKIYNIPILVVDHHFTPVENKKSVVDDYVDVHINPYLVGGTKDITAGMLAYELSRIINPATEDLKQLPALAGIGDRSKGPEFEQYLKKAGTDTEYLKKIAQCVDYEAQYLRFMQDSGLIYDLISSGENNTKAIDLLFSEIQAKIAIQINTLLKYVKVETLKNGMILAIIDITGSTQRGEYPAPGKSIGILNDTLNEKHPSKDIVSIGHGPDFITMRSNEGCEKKGFNVNLLVKRLEKDIPHGMVSGGGHEVAGSVKFIESAKDEVLERLISYIKEL
ncbi:MAG: hypothetical protein ABIG84_03780 [archaeon]